MLKCLTKLVLVYFLISLVVISCRNGMSTPSNKQITTIRVLTSEDLNKMTPQMIVDTLKKYPNDIFSIGVLPSRFCELDFINELSQFSNSDTKSASLKDTFESKVPRHRKTTLGEEIEILLNWIELSCEKRNGK